MKTRTNRIAVGAVLAAACLASFADGVDEPIPSYYEEPGLSRTRDYVGQHANESIDPYTGKLQWHFVDLFIPGNGGMDIKVQRSYSSLGETWPEPSPVGMGWTMHYGRVIRKSLTAICYADPTGSAAHNAVLELPDGSRRVLFPTSDGSAFITTDFWRAECGAGSGQQGLIVYSPDGTRYDMSFAGAPIGSAVNPLATYYTSKITDRNGNTLTIGNAIQGTGGARVTSITASDGRTVNFSYAGGVLSGVTDGARTWTYITAAAGGTDSAQLLEVRRPDGLAWKFDYNPGGGAAGSYSMRKVTYPQGGTIDYGYDFVQFALNPAIPRSTVVKQKVANAGAGAPPATWNWNYIPATQPLPVTAGDAEGSYAVSFSIPFPYPDSVDRTTVSGPEGSRTFYHIGYTSAVPGLVYAIGLRLGMTSDTQNEAFGYRNFKISEQANRRPGDTLTSDQKTWTPVMTHRQVGRAQEVFTTSYGGFDPYANPTNIVETGTHTRTTGVSYYTNASKWIIRQKKNETAVEGDDTYAIQRSFDGSGNMLSETKAGVTTTFTYNGDGDVATRTDARGKETAYSDYHRGIPRTEDQPGGVTITRVVSNAGNITQEKDGENAITGYSYDGLNRVTGITHPVGNPVAVTWGAASRTVTRGPSVELTQYDGFGRTVRVTHTDTDADQTVAQDYKFDALGRRTWESYPNAAIGTAYEYDMLGRVTRASNEAAPGGQGASSKRFRYFQHKTELTNERNGIHIWRHRAYGDPDKQEVIAIKDPATGGENTLIERNVAGQITKVTQGGVARTYGYNANFFLSSIAEPETGTTAFGRDEVGNMISREVGGALTTYTIDDRNRVAQVTYPPGTPGVARTYYKDDKPKSVDNTVARREYTYDGNKNLTGETLTVGGKTFVTGYAYDGNDALSLLTFGSGRTVSFNPDGFGRQRAAGSFVNGVQYHPNGLPSAYGLGNGVQVQMGINTRQLPSSLRISRSGDRFNTSYGYDAAGNVTSITDLVDASYNRALGYDGLDRLTTVNGPWGSGSIGYDNRGNITSQTFGPAGGFSLDYTYNANQRLTSVTGSKPYTLTYDAQGNVTGNGATSFIYNDAAQMRCARCGTPEEIAYTYDGEGQRVRATKAGADTYFVHGQGGQLLWEQTGGVVKEYIYLHGKPVATRLGTP